MYMTFIKISNSKFIFLRIIQLEIHALMLKYYSVKNVLQQLVSRKLILIILYSQKK
jgi:hypothetical protein